MTQEFLSYVRKIETFLGIVVLIAGIVFLVFPLAAIPDETLVGVGAVIAAIVWIAQELRSAWDRRHDGREQRSLIERYETELGALTSSAPERVREVLETLQRKTRESLQEHLASMDWEHFEHLVGAVLQKLGFKDVKVTQPTRDGGVDARATYLAGDVVPIHFAVQVKRTDSVGAPDVQKIRGACVHGEAPMIVTSGRFTQDAVNAANETPRVTLVSGDDLVRLMAGNGIGVRDEIVTVPHADLAALEKTRLDAISAV